MIILSNCLSDVADEGCLKVANSLIKRIKKNAPQVTVVSYERENAIADTHMKLNKLLLSKKLMALLRKKRETVLFVPFPAKAIATVLRIFVLSWLNPAEVSVLMTMTGQHTPITKWILRASGAHIYTLAQDMENFYRSFLPPERVTYLKTGVDTNKFSPVSRERKEQLRAKYALDPDKTTVLHVGHLQAGRNIDKLLLLDSRYQILLVVSTLTKDEQDLVLRQKLEQRGNIRVIDTFLPAIQEIYQLADVYFFPVVSRSSCIDVPLSAMEAAACGKPVVATPFGELKAFRGTPGFYFLESFAPEAMNQLIERAACQNVSNIQQTVREYDWSRAVSCLSRL